MIIKDSLIEETLTRIVLFEKYNPLLNLIQLTDFNKWSFPTPDELCLNVVIENLNNKIIFGEYGYDQTNPLQINFNNVSHIIKNFILKDNIIYGHIQYVDSEKGKLLKELYEKGSVTCSLRATGHIYNETTYIQDIITWDAYNMNLEIK